MDLMLARKESIDPDDLGDYDDHVAERKLDGVRVHTEDGHLYTRSGRDVTAQFPEIDAPEAHAFDGELVTADLRFESANRRVQTEDRFKVDLYADRWPAALVVFDALRINGADVREEPLAERQDLIGPSIPSDAGLVQATTHDDGGALWERAEAEGWEGIMLKDPDAPYTAGRSDAWRKVKRWSEGTFPIVGHEITDNDGFVIYTSIGADEPQKVVVNGRDDQRAVRDADAAEIQYLERTDGGRLRKPSFKGVA